MAKKKIEDILVLEDDMEKKPHVCPICMDEYQNDLMYLRHMKKHTRHDLSEYGIDLEAL